MDYRSEGKWEQANEKKAIWIGRGYDRGKNGGKGKMDARVYTEVLRMGVFFVFLTRLLNAVVWEEYHIVLRPDTGLQLASNFL